MYKGDNKMSFDINLRDVMLLRDDACKSSSRRFISRSQLTTSDEYITLKDLPHSIASRLIAHVPIKVLNTDWADVGIMEYDLLDSLYSDENITHTEPVTNHEEVPEVSEKNAEVEDVVEEDVEEAEAPVEETVAEEAPVEEESSEEVVEDKKSEEEASVEDSIRAAVANKKYNNKFKRKK
jgi:PREDICTED: similar to tumor suppressor TSBF1